MAEPIVGGEHSRKSERSTKLARCSSSFEKEFSGSHFCRALSPTERVSGKSAELSHEMTEQGGDMLGDIMRYEPG